MNVPEPNSFLDVPKLYETRFHGQKEARDAVWHVLVNDYFKRWIPASATVVDIGAGYCSFINAVTASRRLALDINPSTQQHAAPGVSVLTCDLAQTWLVGAQEVDVCFSSNYFEHLPSKEVLVHCLKEAHRVLKDNGTLVILGPNIRFCYDVYWDFFDHFLPLSDRSMIEALQNNEFEVVQSIPRFLPFTMQGQLPPIPALVKLYLQMPFVWPIFGKQFLLIARKTPRQTV